MTDDTDSLARPGSRAAFNLVTLVTGLAVLAWLAAVDYANWLRFSSPPQADPSTGHTVFEKASKGVFYITREQALWTQTALIPIGLVAFAGFLFSARFKKDQVKEVIRSQSLGVRIVGALFLVLAVALSFGGDHVMNLIFNGSLVLPADPRPAP